MKTTELGTTGIQVSALCLGTMYFGTRGGREISYQLLDAYLEAGGSFLDTANIYSAWIEGFHGGESETLLGEWMKVRGNRSGLFLATKVGAPYEGVARGLKAAQIESECEKSLRRLGVDSIDLYYAHADDRDTPVEETMAAFDRLVRAGKVRFTAASNYRAWRLQEAVGVSEKMGSSGYCCIQQRFSYLRPRTGADFGDFQIVTNQDLLDICSSRSITMLAYSPLLKGCYSREDRPVPEQYTGLDNEARLDALGKVAIQCGVNAGQVVLAWMMQSTPAVIPVIGVSTMDQLRDNLGSLDIELSREQLDLLNNAGNC